MSKRNIIDYITGQIKYACEAYPERTGGSEAERHCQRHFAAQLGQWSDNVSVDEYELHPKAFLGWIIPAALLVIAAAVLFWLNLSKNHFALAVAGFCMSTLSLLALVFEFVFYRRFIDFLLPKKRSLNVFASRAPQGEIKQRIIFGGHADAAYEMTYGLCKNKKLPFVIVIGCAAGMAYLFLIHAAALIRLITGGALGAVFTVLSMIAALFIPFFVAIMFFINWRRVVDGANDNLSGCLTAMGILKEMCDSNIRLENTEVCCLITGGEEEGLRGAMAFAERHRQELTDTPSIFIALETLREIDQLQVYTRGINGTQRNSDTVAGLLYEAGTRCGITLTEAARYPGATDAEAFSRYGLQACGLGGVNHEPQTYYHTRYDSPDNISEACIRKALDICLEAAALYDAAIQPHHVLAEQVGCSKVSGF